MQLSINIEDANLQAQISCYISDRKQESSEFFLDVIRQFFQKDDEIAKVVENFQRIEGYEPVSSTLELEVEAFMKANHIEVSA